MHLTYSSMSVSFIPAEHILDLLLPDYTDFARPDSVIDGISVYASRRSMGAFLARRIEAQLSEKQLAEIDAVIPIPETSNTSARVVAQYLKKELVEGFVKNRYIFRVCFPLDHILNSISD